MLPTVMNGKSTDREVAAIVEHVKALDYGDIIPYETCEKLANAKRGEPRFMTVWSRARRKIENELSVTLICVRKEGYRVPQPFEQVKHGMGRAKCGVRAIGRGFRSAAVANREKMTPIEQKTADFVCQRGEYLLRAIQKESRALVVVGTTQVLPRVNPTDDRNGQ